MIPTLKQRFDTEGEKCFAAIEARIDELEIQNKRLKFEQDEIRHLIGSGEPLYLDHETLSFLTKNLVERYKKLRERLIELEGDIVRSKDEFRNLQMSLLETFDALAAMTANFENERKKVEKFADDSKNRKSPW